MLFYFATLFLPPFTGEVSRRDEGGSSHIKTTNHHCVPGKINTPARRPRHQRLSQLCVTWRPA